MPASKREQLIDAALRLFASEGFHATGIDRILAESGVAKMTLYNHFKSKDELILAALRLRDQQFRNHFMQSVERATTDPIGRLLAIFDVLGEWMGGSEFCGCTFINACAEFGAQGDPIRGAAAEHKRLLVNYVRELAECAGASEPQVLAEELSLLMEGAVVSAQVTGDRDAAQRAKTLAQMVLDARLPRAASAQNL